MKRATVIFAEKILVGENLDIMNKSCVLVRDNKIDQIMTQEEFKKTPDKDAHSIIDLKNKTLLPGLIECHTHIGLDAGSPNHLEKMANITECELTLIGLDALKKDLRAGITTARCCGDFNYIDLTMKKKIEDGTVIGPDLLVSGIAIRGLHGFSYLGFPYTGPEEVRKKARENMLRGVDFLKIFTTPGLLPAGQEFIPSYLSPDEIRVVVEDGNRAGVPTSAHCIGGQALVDCLGEKVHVIEHAYFANQKDVDRFHEAGAWMDYTSGIFLDESREEFLSPQNRIKVQYHRESVRKSLEIMIKGGIKFTLGTDAYHGHLYKEVEYAAQAGSGNKLALQGVTTNAAKMCRIDHKTGKITRGHRADLIAVEGNPLDDVSLLKNVSFVMKNGVDYSGHL